MERSQTPVEMNVRRRVGQASPSDSSQFVDESGSGNIFSVAVVHATPAGLIDSPPIMSGSIGLLWVHPDGRIEWRRKCRLNPSPEPLPLIVQERIAHRASSYALVPKELRP